MAEPAFYICNGCSRSWERMEPKMSAPPPRVCPHCNAPPEQQATDMQRERAYVERVYGPIARALTEVVQKKES